MFTIDLLNGQGRPLKTRPGGVAIVAITAIVPILLGIGTLGVYLNNKVIISLKEREIARSKERLDKFSDALEQRETLVKTKIAYSNCLSEISSSIKNYIQWSPILKTVVENMPESVVLTSLDVKRTTIKKEVPKKDDSDAMKEIDVPIRVLRMNVKSAPGCNCDEAVRGFQERLRTSALLGSKLENIRVSTDSEKVGEQDVFSYEITCVFKPGS